MKTWEDHSTIESCLEILTEMRDSANVWSLCILYSFSLTIQPLVNMLQKKQTAFKDGIATASQLVEKFTQFNQNSIIWTNTKEKISAVQKVTQNT